MLLPRSISILSFFLELIVLVALVCCWITPNIRVTISQLVSRYGMLPEDYKQYDPVSEADVMAGDYPKLPAKGAMIHLRFVWN